MPDGKKTVFSGTQPTGIPQLGNYLGAFKNWVKMQDEYNCIFCVVDMHALTVRNDTQELRARIKSLMALYIAMGLDPEKSIIYCQSQVAEHATLAWILNCYTYMGELNRMTQFKDKSAKNENNINAGLYTYPVLMAADILLYNADVVPVGDDQKQHLELARDIAERFNNIYGQTFTVPEPLIGKSGARIMSLVNVESKMSKSENPTDTIFLTDEPAVIMSKFKKAVTDSDGEIRYDEKNKPGVSNLLTIYSCVSGKTIEEAVMEFSGKGYGDFKKTVGEAVVAELEPVQAEYKRIISDKAYLAEVANKGAEKARRIAFKNYQKAAKKVGLAQF